MQGTQSKKLSAAHTELFMAILVQNETVFVHFKNLLKPEHFQDEYYMLLYRVLLDYYNENNQLPSLLELEACLKSVFELESDIISKDSFEALEQFLEFAFDPGTFVDAPVKSEKMERYAYKAGKKLLVEKFKSEVVVALSSSDSLAESLSSFFHSSAAQAELLNQQEYAYKQSLPFKSGWDKQDPMILTTTGIDFFDNYMSGGYHKNEIYAIMAPYGTCKTTLAVMLWCKAAEQCYAETLSATFNPETDRKGLTFLVTYEAPLSTEIQYRSLMYAAGINRNRLQHMGKAGLEGLSNDKYNPLDYEQVRFAKQIQDGIFKPETQRIQEAIPILNDHAVCLDFTGADPDWPHAGFNGVSEIVNRINLEVRGRGGFTKYYVKSVILDYLGLLIDKDVNVPAGTNAEDSKVVSRHVDKIKHLISIHFKCHTWALHQLSGVANSILNPTKKLWHTDAKGSKSFAENLDFCFVVGQLTEQGLGQIQCTKHRRAQQCVPSVIKVDGAYNHVYRPDNFYVDGKGNIVDKDSASAAGSVSTDVVEQYESGMLNSAGSNLQSTDNETD